MRTEASQPGGKGVNANQGAPNTTLRGQWLLAARAGWLGVAALTLGLVTAGVVIALDRPDLIRQPSFRAALAHAGLPDQVTIVVAFIIPLVAFAATGLLIFWRRSDDWAAMLFAITLIVSCGIPMHTDWALDRAVPWLELPIRLVWLLAMFLWLIFLFVFPDGRFVPRWTRLLGAVAIPAAVLVDVSPELSKARLGLTVLVWSVFWGAGLYAQAYRYRHVSGPVQRQQTKWIALAVGLLCLFMLLGIFIPLLFVDNSNAWFAWALPALFPLFLLFPASVAVAILRHRLYDIDLLITRTLVYGLLTTTFTAVYLVIVVGIGTLVGSRGKPNLFLSIVATALIAVAFQPARDRSRRLANRLVYGKRATPYEILSEFSRAMAGASTDDSLIRMARLVVEATGAVKATVWLRLGDLLQPQARWPQVAPLPQPISLDGRGVEQALADTQPRSESFPVGYEDDLLGALTVTASPAEPLTLADEKLIADLATQTGLRLRFQRMKERALFAKALASFLPPEVAELVEASPSALSLREELEATILFSDIRGFSALAERLPAREVAEVVGRHLTAMVEVVTSHGGVLDKFAGDAVMAVFGAPRPSADHAQRALACAAAMQRRQKALNYAAEKNRLPTFQIGIGINTGTVIAGTLGGAGRLDYTVLGDAVNIAQRLQSEAAGGEILAAAVTVRLAGTDRAESLGPRRLKGRQELVDVYRIRWVDTSTAQHPGETAYAE